ncbi:MAG: hypothetical protein IPH78_11115 [Bacteroidetes bacterium]|nr:hypothetical protein [Bacteroidota bacterium]
MAGTIYTPACWEALVGAGSSYYFNAGEVEVYKVELCGIKTGNVANAAYCAGNNISVDFTSVGITYTAGNVFTAELSDASGSFAAPVSIGTLTSTANAGTINAVLPAGTTSGNGYKVRVVRSQNGVQSLNTSNAFIVGHRISTSISTTNHCPGSAVAVNYVVSGCALGAGNVFTAELSDENGSFASPVGGAR